MPVMSDDEDLKDMLDVEFPGGGGSSSSGSDEMEDEQEKEEQESATTTTTSKNHEIRRRKNGVMQAPIVDIRISGWDDDAISKCFQQAIVNYDSTRTSGEFEPTPNRIINQDGQIVSLHVHVQQNSASFDDKEFECSTEKKNENDDANKSDGNQMNMEVNEEMGKEQQDFLTSTKRSIPLPKWALAD
jgi:hypothetical protein